MKNLAYLLFASLFIMTSCASAKQGKWLGEHQSLLTQAMGKNASPEAKLDAVATSFTSVMHQSLNHLNPKKSVQYLNSYSNQNEELIENLLGDIKVWQQGMSTMETVSMGLSLVQKPYFNDFLQLFPRFQNKFNQINTIMNLGGKVRKGLLDVGSKKLLDQGAKMMERDEE